MYLQTLPLLNHVIFENFLTRCGDVVFGDIVDWHRYSLAFDVKFVLAILLKLLPTHATGWD